ncbi:MAG: adenylate/guanylate cyclase domain-containing protein, partial [Ignavibacteria bacterium]
MFPTGNVTFLFTDIEGSTKLAHDYPEILNDFLHYHNAILREAVESNNGFVFKIVGDAFCCSFNSAEDAVKASKDIQISLLKDSNNELIKVRIGIHSGKAEWNGEDYMG